MYQDWRHELTYNWGNVPIIEGVEAKKRLNKKKKCFQILTLNVLYLLVRRYWCEIELKEGTLVFLLSLLTMKWAMYRKFNITNNEFIAI